MDDISDLDCRIFIDAGQTPDGVAALLVSVLADAVEGSPTGGTVPTRWGEIDIRRNTEADRNRARTFPDGFLYFPCALEFYPRPQTRREDGVSLVARVLTFLWDHGLPAVAACDYEGELPKGGGYKDRSIPWPSESAETPESTDHAPNGSPALEADGNAAPAKPAVTD